MRGGLGRRQREALGLMVRNGGRWPWDRIPYSLRGVLETLEARGLVVRDETGWRLP